ncbi:MAG: hypothetical protein ACYCRF_01880 [Acidithiobacillus sp.]
MDKQNQSRVATVRFSAQEADFLLALADKHGIGFGQAVREVVLLAMRIESDQERAAAAEARLMDLLNNSFGALAERIDAVPDLTSARIKEAF